MPKISILIPAYNVEQYIARCLDSVIGQTFGDIEIIIVNDGSTDGTRAIMGEYAARDPRIRLIDHPENCGLLWTRKTGIEASTGDYLMFVDSDDTVDPSICEKLLLKATDEDADLTICGVKEIMEDGSISLYMNRLSYGQSATSVMKSMLLRELWHSLWGKLFARSLLTESSIPFKKHVSLGEDMLVMYSVSPNVNKAVCVEEALYHYRHNPASIMQALSSEGKLESIIKEGAFRIKNSKNVDKVTQDAVVLSEIRFLFNLVKKGNNRKTVMETVRSCGTSDILSLRKLRSTLGLRKALVYWMVFRSDVVAEIVRKS